MSPANLSVKFAPGTFDRLRRSAEARSKLLNEDTKKTLTQVSMKVLVALRASARQSPKRRQVIPTPVNYSGAYGAAMVEHSKKVQTHIEEFYEQRGASKKRSGRRLPLSQYVPLKLRGGYRFSAVRNRRPGEHVLLPIPGARKIAEARTRPQAQITKHGLARSSFGWMMGKLGAGGTSSQVEIPGVTQVLKGSRQDGADTTLSVRMLNKLSYIMSALQGGKKDVSSALVRAREMLMSDTRRALKRMAK